MLRASFKPGGLVLNGVLFDRATPPAGYEAVLGTPSRVVDAGRRPAPPGHRNNQVHLYDELGLYLLEHHATGDVRGVEFALTRGGCSFEPNRAFSGHLTVDGVPIHGGAHRSELPLTGARMVFVRYLDSWSWEAEALYAGLRLDSAQRLVSATYCFRA